MRDRLHDIQNIYGKRIDVTIALELFVHKIKRAKRVVPSNVISLESRYLEYYLIIYACR